MASIFLGASLNSGVAQAYDLVPLSKEKKITLSSGEQVDLSGFRTKDGRQIHFYMAKGDDFPYQFQAFKNRYGSVVIINEKALEFSYPVVILNLNHELVHFDKRHHEQIAKIKNNLLEEIAAELDTKKKRGLIAAGNLSIQQEHRKFEAEADCLGAIRTYEGGLSVADIKGAFDRYNVHGGLMHDAARVRAERVMVCLNGYRTLITASYLGVSQP